VKTNLLRKSAIFKKHAKPLTVCIIVIVAVSMMSLLLTTQGATANLSSGVWINQAHYNTGDMGPYDIPYTLGATSASSIPNIDNCYLPAEIFRGYSRWDANGGYFDLQNTPYLSFDIWVDRVIQIEVGLVDTSNGWTGGYNTLIADTYHNGQANTPPYSSLYGVTTIKSADGAWIIMVGPSDKSTTHYTIDMRTLGCNLGRVGQIIFDFTANHQNDIHWKISNVVVSSDTAASNPAPTVTPMPTLAPTITPSPTAAPTATPKPTVAPTATPTATPNPTATVTPTPEPTVTATPAPTAARTTTPEPTVTPTQQPTNTPTSTPKPTTTPNVAPTNPPQTSTNPIPTPNTPITQSQPSVAHHRFWWWTHLNWPHFWFHRIF